MGTGLGQSQLIALGNVGRLLQVGLNLPELGQVEGCDLLSLLKLLLVGLDLALEGVNQALHALVVLAILITGKGQLLDAALRPAKVLLGVSVSPALGIHLRLELPAPGLHLVHGLLATLKSIGLSLIQPVLHLLPLGLQDLPLLLRHHGIVLLSPELIS